MAALETLLGLSPYVLLVFAFYLSFKSSKNRKQNNVIYEEILHLSQGIYTLKLLKHKNDLTPNSIQILIGTPGALPNIMLDSTNHMASTYNDRHAEIATFQHHRFEGDMDSYFKIYTPEKLIIESMQFLSPDILILFRDEFRDFDVLVQGGTIDMRKTGTVEVQEIIKSTKKLIKKINRLYSFTKTQTMIDALENSLKRN